MNVHGVSQKITKGRESQRMSFKPWQPFTRQAVVQLNSVNVPCVKRAL